MIETRYLLIRRSVEKCLGFFSTRAGAERARDKAIDKDVEYQLRLSEYEIIPVEEEDDS